MGEQELNRKLAEWAGFRPFTQKGWEGQYAPPEGVKVVWTVFKPRFTQSLDACLKWLVPKLHDKYGLWNIGFSYFISDLNGHPGFCKLYFSKYQAKVKVGIQSEYRDANVLEAESGKGAALALCLAIEKLIDEESSK